MPWSSRLLFWRCTPRCRFSRRCWIYYRRCWGDRVRRLILILLVLALLALPAAAMDVTQEQAEQFGLDELERGVPDSAKEWMGELSPDEAVDFSEAVGSIFESALLESGPIWRTAARLMLRVMLIVVLCQMTMTLTEEQGNRAVAL